MNIQHKESVTSTNDWAREHAAAGGTLPMAFLADEQTKGRGQRSNTWNSPVGWTYLSIALPPRQKPQTDLPLQVAEVVRDVLEEQLSDGDVLWVKPPNDIYRCEQGCENDVAFSTKIAGILVEQTGDALILGIGIDYPPKHIAELVIDRIEQHLTI